MPKYLKAFTLTILLTLTVTTVITLTEQVKAENAKTITVPQDYPTISAAIKNAAQGDTILVKNGAYHENLIISKPVSLLGENKAATIIDGGNVGTVVWINADGASLSGFTVQNSGDNFTDSGIYVNNSSGVNVSGNLVTKNNIGVYLSEAPQSTLKDNILSDNTFNFGVYSSNLEGYIQNIDASNLVDGKPIVYWVNQTGRQVPADAGYVAAVNCSGITVNGVSLEKNWQNLLFAYTQDSSVNAASSTLGEDSLWLIQSKNCTLQNLNITGNLWGGVALVNSNSCTIQGSTLKDNGGYGLFLSDCSENQFYHNNFIDNPHQAWLYGVNSNSWDNGYPSGGNYWSNYTGVDQKSGPGQNMTGSDGIGDIPIVIAQNNVDNYPLIAPYSSQPVLSPLQFEFSLMGAIAVVSVFAIIIVYYVKKKSHPEEERGT